jgi:hypothetical protein
MSKRIDSTPVLCFEGQLIPAREYATLRILLILSHIQLNDASVRQVFSNQPFHPPFTDLFFRDLHPLAR